MMKNQIVSLSGGKDSTAMLLMMLERNEPIHSVIWFDTGWEFPEMYPYIEKLEKYTGMQFVKLTPARSFEYWMYERKITARYGEKKGEIHRIGNGWPSPMRRWCTRIKVDTINRYVKLNSGISCIGFAADEQKRCDSKSLQSAYARYPLIEYDVTEAMALEYCKKIGFDWGGLYDVFDRVSCFCCPLGGIRSARKLRKHYPELWARVLEMDKKCPTHNMGYIGYDSAHDLDEQFRMEDCQMHMFRRDSAA